MSWSNCTLEVADAESKFFLNRSESVGKKFCPNYFPTGFEPFYAEQPMKQKQRISERQRALALYHAVVQALRSNFYDRDRLEKALAAQKRPQFGDETGALAAIDRLLSALGDTYTERLVEQSQTSVKVQPEPQSVAPQSPDQSEPEEIRAVIGGNGIAYMHIANFDKPGLRDRLIAKAWKIKDHRGLILDLRNNRGGRMDEALAVLAVFIENGVLGTIKNRTEPGVIESRRFCVNDTQFFAEVSCPGKAPRHIFFDRPPCLLGGRPLVILINSRTASAAEMLTASLVENSEPGKVTLVGSGNTPGKGIGQVDVDVCKFGSRVKLRITRSHWFTPSGQWLGDCGQTVRESIEPEVVVEGDSGIEGLTAARAALDKLLS
jgi:C-terminal processing protease CtpA/Prc